MAGLVEPATGPPHPARPLPGTAPRGRRHLSASRHSDLVGDSLSRCWFILALESGTTQPPQTNVPVRQTQANHQTNQLGRDKSSRPILARAVSLVHSLRIQERHFARGSCLAWCSHCLLHTLSPGRNLIILIPFQDHDLLHSYLLAAPASAS